MSLSSTDFDQFYDHYKPYVSAFVTRRVERDAIQDLVAEVFSVAWRRRDVVPDDALPWLYRTARNLIGNRYRSDARLAALRTKLQAVPAESSADPAEISMTRDRMVDAFTELDDDDRELLLLVAWEGLSTQEVAQVMNISPGNASVRLHRARQRLEQHTLSADETPSTAMPTDVSTTPITSEGERP